MERLRLTDAPIFDMLPFSPARFGCAPKRARFCVSILMRLIYITSVLSPSFHALAHRAARMLMYSTTSLKRQRVKCDSRMMGFGASGSSLHHRHQVTLWIENISAHCAAEMSLFASEIPFIRCTPFQKIL